MQSVSSALRDWFANQLYPTIVVGTSLFLLGLIAYILLRAWSARVTAGAIVPVFALAFVVAAGDQIAQPVSHSLDAINDVGKIALGAVVAVLMFELSRLLLRRDAEIGPAVYALLLSSGAMFIIYAMMSNWVASLHWLLFGFVSGGGLYIVFRGMPLPKSFGRSSPYDKIVSYLRKEFRKTPPAP